MPAAKLWLFAGVLLASGAVIAGYRIGTRFGLQLAGPTSANAAPRLAPESTVRAAKTMRRKPSMRAQRSPDEGDSNPRSAKPNTSDPSAPGANQNASARPDSAGDEEPRDPDQAQQDEAQARFEFYQQLDQRFDSEIPDGSWQHLAESELAAALSPDPAARGGRARLESVNCKASTCRTTVGHDSADIDRDYLLSFVRKTAADFEHHFKYEPGRTTIYSIRAGAPGRGDN